MRQEGVGRKHGNLSAIEKTGYVHSARETVADICCLGLLRRWHQTTGDSCPERHLVLLCDGVSVFRRELAKTPPIGRDGIPGMISSSRRDGGAMVGAVMVPSCPAFSPCQ